MMSIDSDSTTKVATSKIVVGVALAVAAAIGVSVFAVTAKHETQVAQTHVATPLGPDAQAQAPAADPNAVPAIPANPAPNNDATALSADTQALAQTASPPAAGAVTPDDSTKRDPMKGDSTKSKSAERAEHRVARTHSTDDVGSAKSDDSAKSASSVPGARANDVASAGTAPSSMGAASTAAPASSDVTQSPARPAASDAAPTAPQASSSGVADSVATDAASDTQITAQVRSEVATAAPNSNVDVTTANGDVALAGSVPTQDAADHAKQAAMRVAGVRHVDASGLTISNQ